MTIGFVAVLLIYCWRSRRILNMRVLKMRNHVPTGTLLDGQMYFSTHLNMHVSVGKGTDSSKKEYMWRRAFTRAPHVPFPVSDLVFLVRSHAKFAFNRVLQAFSLCIVVASFSQSQASALGMKPSSIMDLVKSLERRMILLAFLSSSS